MNKDKLIIGGIVAVIAVVLFAVFSMFPMGNQSVGGTKRGQVTILDKATTTSVVTALKSADLGEYNNCILTTYVENDDSLMANDKYTLKFQGYYGDDMPTFTSSATSSLTYASSTSRDTISFSSKNLWQYIPVTNAGNNASIGAGVATSVYPNTVIESFTLPDQLRYVGIEITAASTTKVTGLATSTPSLSAFVNCQKE